MSSFDILPSLTLLGQQMEGDLYTDQTSRLIYATDASAYREIPLAVARPKNANDIKKLIAFAREHKRSLIPRTAGTSLAGQVVGEGIIVDVSKYMTSILEINPGEHWVRVEPGVVLDELNKIVAEHGLFFGPETSTSNRCMIGGMVGNNSCGAHSLLYGSTREHTLEIKALLSDGSEAHFKSLTQEEFAQKCAGNTLEATIYRNSQEILSDPFNQDEIRKEFPDPKVERRNTGYAIDLLLETSPFSPEKEPFNFCKLLAGSEGTLAFITEIKLNLVPLPPKETGLVCVHMNTLMDAMYGNLIALKHKPGSVELMDKPILDLTKENIEQRKNRFFLEGDPEAILIVEFVGENRKEIEESAKAMEAEMRAAGYGYAFPVVYGPETKKVWNLRKAGLGVLSNMPGDAMPVPVSEDTAVSPEVLPDYIREFKALLDNYGLTCVYYAHIATGELHLRPVLNLKNPAGVELFRTIARETAILVKKYRGSLSGEHGDGRLRGEFIPIMIGEHNYGLLKSVKKAWDPEGIFNPGKITDTPVMNTSLRFEPGKPEREIETFFDFSREGSIGRAAEKCNGSADCRKSEIIGGTMCPSYMASRNESQTTRARANLLREFLISSTKKNPFDHKEIYDIMDLCLSCKACKSECPSNVDVAKLKAEFLQHYYDANGTPLRARAVAYIPRINRISIKMPGFTNFMMNNPVTGGLAKSVLGFSSKRKLPALHKTSLEKFVRKHNQPVGSKGTVWFFADEFTNYNDAGTGIKAILLLNRLGYEVKIPPVLQSGRTYLSKGLVRTAQKLINKNIEVLRDIISEQTPLIGLEPSALLSFRDEYPELAFPANRESAVKLSKNALLIDEFIAAEFDKGRIDTGIFTKESRTIRLHGHCQQKSIASTSTTLKMLTIPENYKASEIPSGCCGMAGSFGYEKEHYELSMKIGELVLFPEVRKLDESVIVAAPGTSCRHQIKDGTGKTAKHPVEVLFEALKS